MAGGSRWRQVDRVCICLPINLKKTKGWQIKACFTAGTYINLILSGWPVLFHLNSSSFHRPWMALTRVIHVYDCQAKPIFKEKLNQFGKWTEHNHKYIPNIVDITMSSERIVAIFIIISLAVLSAALPRPQPETSVFSH